MSAAIRAARSRLADARDQRALAADAAMLALHDPKATTDSIEVAMQAWRIAADAVESAAAEVALQRTTAGQLRVVAS